MKQSTKKQAKKKKLTILWSDTKSELSQKNSILFNNHVPISGKCKNDDETINNDLEGHVIYLFVVSKNNKLNSQITKKIVSNFGAFALPKEVYYISELPKTRSGKILRRLLRTILINPNSKNYGDLSTMLNSKVIQEIKKKIIYNVKN